MILKKCEKCGEEISTQGYKKHYTYCGNIKSPYKNRNKNPNKSEIKVAWNKGLTKENDDRVKKYSETNSNKRNNPEYVSPLLGRTISEEVRKKISESQKKYYLENPDKIPYLVHHNSKGESYPEKYFTELFEKENIEVIKKFRIRLYELDFCILDKKIDIEIDGDQHIRDKRIVESDIRRNEYLESLGWTVIRIKWSEYQKMNFEEKNNYVQKLKKYINDLCEFKPSIEYVKRDSTHDTCECGKEKNKKAKLCIECHKIHNSKTIKGKNERPPLEQLLKEIEETNYCVVGRKYGVSDNTIRKWIESYQKEKEI